ncbi:MAG: hypothetical protein KJ578_08310 [Bacteroidetes bacterium]|nr:hypothetical protein [Bacteroidota bacterium]MBU1579627.1 hypothetical protein [Bacteroidota bacterium]MBU2464715.1 hypothetical protein [Bacteroidota bacterium]MBU2557764.1 hypothetical protein [Bacteroidota bacterium]
MRIVNNLMLLLIFMSFFMLLSCSKDDIPKKSLLAGDTTDVAFHRFFNPPLQLSLIWDEQKLYGNATDSLDIDNDQVADVFFRLIVLNPDSLHLLEGEMPNPFPSLHIYGRDSLFETATISETVYVGLGTTTKYYWVEALEHGQLIDETRNWKPANYWGEKLWSENPVSMLSNGPWFEKAQPAFVAFRLRGALGWIKMDTHSTDDPLIMGFALQAPS